MSEAAKDAYTAWSLRMGIDAAFEHLSARERAAWESAADAVADYVTEEIPRCECGAGLVCPACDGIDCAKCGATFTCPVCTAEGQEPAL